MTTAFPNGPEQLTAEWIGAQVGAPLQSFGCEQIGVGVGLLGRLFRLTLTGDGAPATVIAKFPTLDEGARMNVTDPLGFYANEVNFYTEAAAEAPIATPRVHFAGFDGPSGNFALLLEDLADRRGVDQTIGCDDTDANTAVDALAALHTHWWDRAESVPWLKSYLDAPYPEVIAGMYKQAWVPARDILGARMPGAVREFGDRFVDLLPWFLEEASQPPLTLCHGDFRLDNLFFATQPEHPAVTVIDWQICFRGNPGYDVGYFLSQSIDTDVRRECQDRLIDRYLGALNAHGIEVADDELRRAVARTAAYCFIYPVVSVGQIETTNERHRALVEGMLDRSVAAIEDLDALSLLPA